MPKRGSDKLRIILDLSHLNKYILCPSFKMLTLKDVKLHLPRNHFTVSLDLKDGYWHVPIAPAKRSYLGFIYKGVEYNYRAMPFGLNVAPRIFTKLITHVAGVIASRGIFMMAYLDDLLIVAKTHKQCLNHLHTVVDILIQHGWIINIQKSRLNPLQTFQWLGVQWDLQSHLCSVPVESREKMFMILRDLIQSKLVSKRDIMKAQGFFNWCGLTDMTVKPLMSITRRIIKNTRQLHLDEKFKLPLSIKMDLIATAPKPFYSWSSPAKYRSHHRCIKGRLGNKIK